MGVYADRVLPRVMDLVLDNQETRRYRRLATEGVSGTVLEVGFGSGLNLAHYPAEVERVLAVEPASGARDRAARRVEDAPFPVTFVGLEGESLPVPDESVDAVVSTWTLCTIPGVDQALAEMRRVLRPGGTLHFVEHGRHPDRGVERWQRRLNPIQRAVAGGCHLDRRIDLHVRRAGFELTDLHHHQMRAPRTHGYLYQGVATRPR